MNTNTWARPIVIPRDASLISHANRALSRAEPQLWRFISCSGDNIYFLFRGQNLFLVQRRRVFALVGGAEVRQGTRFICKRAFASSPAVQPSPSPSTKLLNLPYLVFVFVSISWICISDNLQAFAETQLLPRCNIPLTCSKPRTHNKIMRATKVEP